MHPILFEIGPIKIFTYGFLLALGFLSAIFVAGREAKRLGIPPGKFFDLCFYIILAALVGSRLLYVIAGAAHLPGPPPENLRPVGRRPGLSRRGHPGLPGGLLLHPPPRPALAPHPGRPGPGDARGAIFRASRLFYGRVLLGLPHRLALGRGLYQPQHPLSLCGGPCTPPSFTRPLALGVFGFLYWFRTRKRFDGQLILMYFCLAGLVRFMVEFFRSPLDYRGPVFFGWMPMTQLIALGLFLVVRRPAALLEL